jgi:hypothetical protein
MRIAGAVWLEPARTTSAAPDGQGEGEPAPH